MAVGLLLKVRWDGTGTGEPGTEEDGRGVVIEGWVIQERTWVDWGGGGQRGQEGWPGNM